MLSQIPIPFKDVLNIVTLETLGDLTSIANSVTQQDVSWLVAIIVVIKWAALITALSLFYLTILPKLKVKNPIIPFIATAVTVLVICLFFTNPFVDMDSIEVRFSKIVGAISSSDSSNLTYTPSLLSDIPFQNPIRIALSKIPTNVSAPAIENDQFVFKEFNVTGVLLIVMLVAAIILLSKLSKLITIVVCSLIVATLIGLSDEKILDVVIIVSSFVVCYLLLRTKTLWFLVTYPIALSMLAAVDILQPPVNVVFIVSGIVFVISLIPVFYIIGLFLKSIGAIRETRTKFGMKKKPAKVIEEYAGEYDPLVVSVILSALFTASIILYGTTIGAIGFFTATVVGILRR